MSGRDRISELPDCLLTQILSYVSTKQSVETSVLSKRWENLYLSVPVLDLDCSSVPYDADQVFLSFIDKLLEFSPESILFKVKVKCRDTMIRGFRDRIDIGSQDIGYLKLTSSGLRDPAGFVYMPCLKFMHLEQVVWDTHLDTVISGCPVLEELTLLRDPHDKYKALLVRTQSLKRFRLLPLRNGYVRSRVKCTLEIDTPGLEYMSLGDDHIDSIVVKNLTSLLVVELDIKFVAGFAVHFDTWNLTKRSEIISDFLNGISSVSHMIIISAKTVQAFDHYSKAGMIPKFNNLSCLQAVFRSYLLQFLPAFLECCPNLKHLLLVVHSGKMDEGLKLTDVPRCVSSTLECVEIQEKLELEEGKMKATSYFLGNSAVLKKLILSPTAYDPRDVLESEIWEKVNKLKKRSPGCEIIIRAMEED
ncbi:hypothetical protein HID58_036595 [Brassica napus]|uniref:F-box domain-containing protein n=1 Tax=Brassica napus TaxID=3708 RepID=A0ABQ8C872_BRANA|nr:hypothetical protein HID58_036595 [Brassica napus]